MTIVKKSKSGLYKTAAGFLIWLVAACTFSPPRSGDSVPTVLSSSPASNATGVALDGTISATFSEEMDPATLTSSTFTLTSGIAAIPVLGTVIYADSTVVFQPTGDLESNGLFTATISTDASSASGVALATEYAWSFTGRPAGIPVSLGTAGDYVTLAKTAISGTGAVVTGDLGISPAFATSITGFSLIDPATSFSTSAQVTGKVFAADYAAPTPAKLTAAVIDMGLAFTAAAARTPDVTELGNGNIGGMTLLPGVYRWSTAVMIPTDVTLTGSASDVWIFQIAETLGMAAQKKIVLTGGAVAKNVFWQVSGAVTVGAGAHVEGVVLTATAVTFGAGTSIKGRLLAQSAVTITGSVIVQPAP